MGRKAITWDEEQRKQFKNLCGIFCTRREVCTIMGLDAKTLNRLIDENFRDEVAPGSPEPITYEEAFEVFSSTGKASLRRKQFEMAMDGDKTMLIWMGKNYLGQSEEGASTQRRDAPPPEVNVLALHRNKSPVRKVANG